MESAAAPMDKDPDKNIPKVLNWIDKVGGVEVQAKTCRDAFENKDGVWYKYIKSFWSDIDDAERKTIFENFIVNATMLGGRRRNKYREKENCSIPWAILMDPTSACNLHCTGCWAAEYGNKLNMTLEELDSIIEQGKKMGVFMILITQRIGTACSADKILVLENGERVGFGRHEELMEKCAVYRDIYDSQIGGDL